jgi:hypothetical protein
MNFLRHRWCSVACAGLLLVALAGVAARADEPKFFRIGTASTGGSFFEIGGVIASAISRPADGPACDRGGSCGVPGLVAVAQATPGSIENLKQINGGQLESGFAQADIAGWAYKGTKVFSDTGPLLQLRALASLFPEAVHLAVRADSPIRSLADLKGRSVSYGDPGSGTAVGAAVVLAAAGLGDNDIVRKNLRPGPAVEELREGRLDAVFLIGGYPIPVLRDLAASMPIRLIPIEGEGLEKLRKDFNFYGRTEIPGGNYPGIDTDTPTLGFSAVWLVNADIDADLVFAIAQSLWNPTTGRLLANSEAVGKRIELSRAVSGLPVPLHPGAARYYRERGLLTDRLSEQSEPGDKKAQ